MNFLTTAAAFAVTPADQQARFMEHIAEQGLSYGTREEFEFRFALFSEADKKIEEANSDTTLTFTMEHNMFSTMTQDEMERYTGYREDTTIDSLPIQSFDAGSLADSVDWRTKGVVNPVQNQASCGSCWAFSSIAAMESSHAIQTGELLKLSEQQFVDCSKGGNEGCNGGLEVWAF